MPSIRAEKADGLLIVTMSRGKANALNAAMVDELNSVLSQSHAHDIGGLVLASDCPNFFSGGFDVTEVFQYDRHAKGAAAYKLLAGEFLLRARG